MTGKIDMHRHRFLDFKRLSVTQLLLPIVQQHCHSHDSLTLPGFIGQVLQLIRVALEIEELAVIDLGVVDELVSIVTD